MNVKLNVHVDVPESLHEAACQHANTGNLHRALEVYVGALVQKIIDAEAADAEHPRTSKSSKKKPAKRR